jgi:hypothetical protein
VPSGRAYPPRGAHDICPAGPPAGRNNDRILAKKENRKCHKAMQQGPKERGPALVEASDRAGARARQRATAKAVAKDAAKDEAKELARDAARANGPAGEEALIGERINRQEELVLTIRHVFFRREPIQCQEETEQALWEWAP